MVAYEIDQRLIPVLNDTLGPYDNVAIINEDILKADVRGMIEEEMTAYKEVVVINLPYYITTPILMNFLMQKLPIDRYYVMMQKKSANVSVPIRHKAYGSLSIAIDYYTDAKRSRMCRSCIYAGTECRFDHRGNESKERT